MARFEQAQEDFLYHDYVTTSLQLAPQNAYLSKKWREVINPDLVDNRTGDEIAQDIIKQAGLQFED